MYKDKCTYIFYICTHIDAHALANGHMWVRAGPHIAMADQKSSTFEKCASVHVCVCVCIVYVCACGLCTASSYIKNMCI